MSDSEKLTGRTVDQQQILNALGQPIGAIVNDWQEPSRPMPNIMQGRYCRLEPLNIEGHAAELFANYGQDNTGALWTYLPYGPFDTLDAFQCWMETNCLGNDPLFYAIVDEHSGQAVGVASYLRIEPKYGSIEVGHINYSPCLQRTSAATEAMYLMMKNAFELGYRRYEWKCNALNLPSRKAAQRLGFSFEGVFRQHLIIKGHSRDTAWYAVIDSEWPALNVAYQTWLAPDNFDQNGQQKNRLSDFTAPILHQCDSGIS